MSCTITTREIEGVTLFDISGRMSVPDHQVQELVAETVKAGHKNIVLNFAKVTYLDSYGLHDLVTTYNAVKAAGGKMNLLAPTKNVRKTIEITMKGIFEFYEDEAAAIAAAR